MNELNAAQEQAFDQITELMREHFDAGAFSLLALGSDHSETIRYSWHGGAVVAIGLFQLGAKKAFERMQDINSPPNEEQN